MNSSMTPPYASPTEASNRRGPPDRRARRRAVPRRPPIVRRIGKAPGRSARPCGARCKNRARPTSAPLLPATLETVAQVGTASRSISTNSGSLKSKSSGNVSSRLTSNSPSEPKDFDTRATADAGISRHGLGSDEASAAGPLRSRGLLLRSGFLGSSLGLGGGLRGSGFGPLGLESLLLGLLHFLLFLQTGLNGSGLVARKLRLLGGSLAGLLLEPLGELRLRRLPA